MPLKFSRFSSLVNTTPTEHELDWPEFVSQFSSYEVVTSKEGASGWSPATFEGKRSLKSVREVSFLVFDVDHDFDVSSFNPPHAFLVHETYTSGRWRIVVPLAAPVAARKYTQLFKAVAADLKALGIEVDHACSDASRFFFVPSKPPDSTRKSAHRSDLPLYDSTAAVRKAEPTRSADAVDLAALAERASPEVRALLNGQFSTGPGKRDQDIHQAFNSLAQLDHTLPLAVVEHVAQLATRAMGEAVEPEGALHWQNKALRSYQRGTNYAKERQETLQQARDIFLEEAPWRERLHTAFVKDGEPPRISNDLANQLLILENDQAFKQLRYNVVKLTIECPDGPLANLPLDHMSTELVRWFSDSEYRLKITRETAKAAISRVAYSRLFDPISHYLNSLTWDGTPRIRDVLHDICNVRTGNEALVKEFSFRWFISAAARALSPGCQADSLLVLVGPGGAGKTQFARILGGEFYDSIVGDVTSKDVAMKLTGAWIVEKEELAVSNKSSVEEMRAFISERTTKIRLPYAADITAHPRHCVFVATANGAQPIVDHDGTRRFWPVDVTPFWENLPKLQAIRDQLWAEAVVMYKQGEHWHLKGAFNEAHRQEVELFKHKDEFCYEIEEYIRRLAPEKRPRRERPGFYTTQVCGILPAKIDKRVQMRIADSLKVLGFTKKRLGNNGDIFYITPDKYLDPDFGKAKAEDADDGSLGH